MEAILFNCLNYFTTFLEKERERNVLLPPVILKRNKKKRENGSTKNVALILILKNRNL